MIGIILLIFIISAIGVYFYLERTKDKRLKRIRNERKISPEDEAYNKVKRTKGITKMMKRKGKDIDDVEPLVERADKIIKRGGDASTAKELVEKAEKRLPEPPSPEDEDDETKKKGYTIDELDEIEFEESEGAKKRREELEKQREKLNSLPENYLESKFEMKKVREMLDKEDVENEEAEEYYLKAERCFEDEDYTGALKYSVECRKLIKGDDAGVIPSKDGEEEMEEKIIKSPKQLNQDLFETDGKEAKKDIDKEPGLKEVSQIQKEDEEKKPEKVCPDCGYEGGKKDEFCPKCGTDLEEVIKCPNCGAEADEDDKFCSKCGNELQEMVFVCPDCEAEVDAEAKFCPKCGVELE